MNLMLLYICSSYKNVYLYTQRLQRYQHHSLNRSSMKTHNLEERQSEKELLLRIAEGDERAFASLFHAWQARIFSYIRKIVKSRQIAEEVTMDVMTKLWLNREMLAQVEQLDAFLFCIAHRRSIDFLRSAARSPMVEGLLWDDMQRTDTVSADSAINEKECEEKLREAIGLLSPQRRKVFELSRESHLSHGEIAARLNLSKYTVSNHITQAAGLIRHYLTKHLDLGVVIIVHLID